MQLPNGMMVLLISDPNTNQICVPKPSESADEGDVSEEDEEEDEEGEEEGEEEEEEEDGADDDSEDENASDEESVKGSRKLKKNKSKEGERMAAASLCVKVGSFSDPSDIPGLAHFLEHMAFMGSHKFPQENAFDEFLKVIKRILIWCIIASTNK